MAKPKNNHLFHVDLPPGWTDGTIHFFQGPEEGGVRPVLSLAVDDPPETKDVEEYARERIENAMASFPGAELVRKERTPLESGEEAETAVIRYGEPGSGSMFKRLDYLIIDGVGYNFVGTFTKRQMKTVALQVEEMIKRFNPSKKR